MDIEPEPFLLTLMQKALAAVKPVDLVRPHLDHIYPSQKVTVVGCGKASAQMALGVEQVLGHRAQGVVVVPYGYEADCHHIQVLSAAHPLPDQNGIRATRKICDAITHSSGPILALISGGGSSVLTAPAPFITLQEKQDILAVLLAKGTRIGLLNQIRGVLSSVKAGGLLRLTGNRQVRVLVLSDVPGNDPNIVASGPFALPTLDGKACLAILEQANIHISEKIRHGILSVTPAPYDRSHVDTRLIGGGFTALQAAQEWVVEQGITVINLGDALEGCAEEIAQMHLQHIQPARKEKPILILSGGEATVEVTGSGQGGPNRHFLLSLANMMPEQFQLCALAMDTDGRDGSDGEAGAWFNSKYIMPRHELQNRLANCASGGYFKAMGTSIHTGPTGTNVNDFRAILVRSNHDD